MAINPIIKKQRVKIDDHLWGAKEEKTWNRKDRDIHLDKWTLTKYRGKEISITVKIPLNSEHKVEILSNNLSFEEIPRNLRKEIHSAFKDSNIRQTFYSNIAFVLENYKSNLSNISKAKVALKKIAAAFGLDWDNLIELWSSENQNNKYYAKISDNKDIYLLKMNEESIVVEDTMQ